MMWTLRDLSRYRLETDAVEALSANSGWLKLIEWRVDDALRLCADADIITNGRVWPVTLRYGHNFPYGPPSVLPRVAERWSEHQYQRGELCLEFRADNWQSNITGANMLESAHRLLLSEAPPLGSAEQPAVPNAHALTLGQRLRYRTIRYFYTSSFERNLPSAPKMAIAKFTDIGDKSYWRVCISELRTEGGYLWSDPEVPPALVERNYAWPGFLVRLDEDADLRLENLGAFLAQVAPELATRDKDTLPIAEIMLVCTPTRMLAYLMAHKDQSVLDLAVVPPSPGRRLAASYAGLNGKRVGIIGCGSVGSKIAASLARSGVLKFVLIDDDVFGPENIVRNELDWQAVADHKGNALKKRLEVIHAQMEVDVRLQKLGGQEAGATIDGTLSALGQCDLIIDASANATAFNYAASVAVRKSKPMIWGEVFGGGFGGLIARSRPGLDPEPQSARAQILHWCDEKGVPAPVTANDYGIAVNDATFIADDADVTVLAAHLARYAIDILCERSPSIFPHSAYLIGLAGQWIFEQPFDVYPIDLQLPDAEAVKQSGDDPASFTEVMRLLEGKL